MMIDRERQIMKLDTPHTSYVMAVVDGKYLGHVYYGKRLGDADLRYLLRTDENPLTPNVNPAEEASFYDQFAWEYPTGGVGDFRESCMTVRNVYGQRGGVLILKEVQEFTGEKEPLPGLPSSFGTCDQLRVTLTDEINDLDIVLTYSAFQDTDVITRSVSAVNRGETAVTLERLLSADLDLDNDNYEVMTMHGAWAREHIIQREPIPFGAVVSESLRGESGHEMQPFMALVSKHADQNAGEVYAMNFVYSGNVLCKLQRSPYDRLRMVMGIHPETFEWKLNPGDSFQAPEVVMVYSGNGIGQMTRTFHDFYRAHLIRSRWQFEERPILVNNWEATYFDFDSQKLYEIAEEASKHGINMLVCDDGWFGHHRNTPSGDLGDWFVNEQKFQGGLHDFVEKINGLGMKFGIWFEPEMISEDSDLFRAHPDWVLKLHGRTPSRCRDQWVLDFSNPEVVDYIFESMKQLLHSANIEYVKWDMNRPLCDLGSAALPPDRQGEITHRHVLGVYEIQERLLQEFPNLLLENCSSGGARFDPGMLYYSPQIWCSDDMDPVERLSIDEGTAMLYPLSAIGSHVSKEVNDITGRRVPFETRAAIAAMGTFGYELDLTELPEEERSQIDRQTALYRELRPLIQTGDYYRIASYRENGRYDVVEILSADQSEGVLFSFQVLAQPNGRSRRIRLEHLLPDAEYEIDGRIMRGDVLMYAGLPMKWIKQDFSAEIIRFRRVSQ